MYLLNCCLKCVISVCPLLPFFPSVQLVHLALFICSEKSVSLGFLCSSECSSLSSCSCIKIKHTHLASFILFYLLIYCLKKDGFLICAPSPTVQWWIFIFFFSPGEEQRIDAHTGSLQELFFPYHMQEIWDTNLTSPW